MSIRRGITLSFDVNSLKFDQAGLLPAIVQDKASGEVVMLAYMNKTAVEKTLATKETWFWSRSRQELWHKGATSGNVQKVLEVLYDCDRDTLLVKVVQNGAACHEGYFSCFHNRIEEDGSVTVVGEKMFDPDEVYKKK
jgi:phosphoribosyl-AMP cyclohydrolase